MRWIGYVATILWWSGIARSLSSLNRGHSYKISPKPCRVPGTEGVEGTCMFVWECIKSEGTHVGVCVDTFMFGSCCVHNSTDNTIGSQPHGTAPNTLRPSLAEALASESTRLTLTSLATLPYPASSSTTTTTTTTTMTTSSTTSRTTSTKDTTKAHFQSQTGASTRPNSSGGVPRPLHKRPHAKPTSDREDESHTSVVPNDGDFNYSRNKSHGNHNHKDDHQSTKRPYAASHPHQQPTKTRPDDSQHRPLDNKSHVNHAMDHHNHQGFMDKIDNGHDSVVIRLPNKDQTSDEAQPRPQRPQNFGQKPSEFRPDDGKTQDSDLAVQESVHRPNVNPLDEKESMGGSHPSLNFIHTERPQWATKPVLSNKPSSDYSKPYFSVKTTTLRPISIGGKPKPDGQHVPTRTSTTHHPTYHEKAPSTSAAGSVPQTLHWQITTEPAFVTKQRPSTGPGAGTATVHHETTKPGSYFWSDNSWTPPKPSIKPHWTDHPNLMHGGPLRPEGHPQRPPNFKPTEPQEGQEYQKPLGSAHYITTSYIETSTKSRPAKKPTTTTSTTTSTTSTSTTTSTTTTTTHEPPRAHPGSKTGSVMTVAAATESRGMQCGVPPLFPRPETRIVGGKDAPFGRWPWQVSVRRTSFFGFSSTHRCGGAVLNENWIATAGHCVDDLLTSQIRIRVGEYDFSSVQERLPYVERSVAKKVVHPKYNFFTYEYDLALVRLESPLTFAPHISPICLPAVDELLIGENATVTGWGRLSEGGTLPSVLQEVSVPIVSNDKCKSMFLQAGRQEFIPDIFLCAGHETGGRDSCQGDSGGPLQVRGKDGRYFLAGIISWGIGCAEANLPGVCTRISKFVPWILKNVT